MAETGSGLLPLGATIAITVGCAALVLAIMIVCFCHFYLRKKRKMKTDQAREIPLLLYGNRIQDVSFRRNQNGRPVSGESFQSFCLDARQLSATNPEERKISVGFEPNTLDKTVSRRRMANYGWVSMKSRGGNSLTTSLMNRQQPNIYTNAPAADRLSQVLYAHRNKANTHARHEMPPFAAFNDDVKSTSYTYPNNPWNAHKAAQKDWGEHSFVTQSNADGQSRLYDIPKKPRPVRNSTNEAKLFGITSKYDSSGSRLAVDLGITEGTHSPEIWRSIDDRPPMRLPSYAHKHDSFRDSQGADLGLGSYAASSLWL